MLPRQRRLEKIYCSQKLLQHERQKKDLGFGGQRNPFSQLALPRRSIFRHPSGEQRLRGRTALGLKEGTRRAVQRYLFPYADRHSLFPPHEEHLCARVEDRENEAFGFWQNK